MIETILKPIKSLMGFSFLKSKSGVKEEIVEYEKVSEIFSVEDIYTPLSVAKEEIWRRWNDKDLLKKVEDFFGGDLPDFAKGEPRAVFSRDIISPTKEFCYFLELANQIGLRPALVEYSDGKFVAKNLNKYYLGKMCFHDGIGKKGGDKIENAKVIDFNTMEGKRMKDIKTLWGQDFCQFHHELTKKVLPNVNPADISDFSDWFNRHRKMTEYYYLHYLALFLVHGVLFENFIIKNGEREFTEKVIIPSFKKLEEIFGIKPLVVPIALIQDECELYWWYYPNIAKKIVVGISGKNK